MAVSNVKLCGICDAQHISNVANYWCPECDEGMCSPCQKYHSVSKASRQHGIISIDDYKKLPAEIVKIEQNCTEHDKKFQMFCPRHDQLCCIMCVSENHKECTGMFLIDDVIKSSRSSTLFDSLEKSLKDIQENIEMVVKDRKANLDELKQHHLKSLNDIKDTRRKVNSRLDEIEKNIIDDLNSTETQVKLKIETLLNKLSEKKKVIEILMINLMSVKQHGSDLQAFIGSKLIEKDVNKELDYIRHLSKDLGFSHLGFKYLIDDKMTDVLSKLTSFGSVSMESSPSSNVITFYQEKQAQIFSAVPPRPKSMDDLTASWSGEFTVENGKSIKCITGLAVFPDGRIILADCNCNRRLIIVQSNGTFNTEMILSPLQPFDVTCIDDNTVGVSSLNSTIVIVDTKNKLIKKSIITGVCRGITYGEGKIMYCEQNIGVVAIQLSDCKLLTLVKDNNIKSSWSYITTAGENIYYTDENAAVKCYSVNGEKLWEYKNAPILSDPTGIAVDQFGIVYVTSIVNNCVVLISADGKHSRKFLTEQEEIKDTYGIHMHHNKLNVVNYDGRVIQFYIV